jgi:pyruvate, orthophosphate dikinase
MPGMMDTVLNVGCSRDALSALAAAVGDWDFVADAYRGFLRMFAVSVRGATAERVDAALADVTAAGPDRVEALARALDGLVDVPVPDDSWAQLRESIDAVFRSWNSPRAMRYREYAGLDDTLGTAVVIQAMVFGNMPADSGAGVAFTRDPATGEPAIYGEFEAMAQGEVVVGGGHRVGGIEGMEHTAPEAATELSTTLKAVEREYRDLCEVEFTVERGKLWLLQARVAQRTARAAVRVAIDLVDEGIIDWRTALDRIPPAALLKVAAPVLDRDGAQAEVIGHGAVASPGSAVGPMALSSTAAQRMRARGLTPILVRTTTSPEDVAGFIAAAAIVTAHGGRTSHAAVVARGMDRPAVCGVEDLLVEDTHALFGGTVVQEGELLSVDAVRGEILAGQVALVAPPQDAQVVRLLAYCDENRRVPLVIAPLETPGPGAPLDERSRSAVVCCTVEDLPSSASRSAQAVVVCPNARTSPGLLLTAAARLAEAGTELWLGVGVNWPERLTRVPDAMFRGVWADPAVRDVGRFLAAVIAPGGDDEPAGGRWVMAGNKRVVFP